MPRNLVIVESPAKARTIERYLGDDYRVLASYGHVRDLPENPGKGKFGVDVDHDFAPEYVVSDDRRKQVTDIEKAAKGSDLEFALGYSHPVPVQAPDGITFEVESPTKFTVKGIDKQAVGQVAAELRAYRPPEPYKGKGVRYQGEQIKLKETKKK